MPASARVVKTDTFDRFANMIFLAGGVALTRHFGYKLVLIDSHSG